MRDRIFGQTCRTCGYSYVLEEFPPRADTPLGVGYVCTLCEAHRLRTRRETRWDSGGQNCWRFAGAWWQSGETVREGLARLRAAGGLRQRRIAAASVGHCQVAVSEVYAERDRLVAEDGIERDVHHIIPLAHGGAHAASNLVILTKEAHIEYHRNNPTRRET